MSDILNVKFTASADFGQLISEANKAMAVLSKFRNNALASNIGLDKKDFDTAVGEFRKAVTAAGLYNSTIVDVTSTTTKFGNSLAQQRLKLKDYYSAWAEYSRGAQGQIRKLAQEQVRIQSSVIKSLGRDMSGAQKAMVFTPTGIDAVGNAAKIAAQELSIYHKVLRDGSTSLINWGKNTQWAGRQLTVGLTLPLTIFGKSASEAFKMADQELTRLLKVYGGIGGVSASELGKVKKDVTELAKTLSSTYGASFQETLGLAADIAATGKEGNDLLGSIAETTRLATLGDVDRQEAMKATLALQTAFNMNTKDLAESINFLNAVENQTSTTLQDLVEAIPKAGPVIQGLGGGVKELAVLLTAMREGGVNASEGANALKSGLASLINPTKVSVEMMNGFGIAINDIVQSNAGDIIGLLTDLQKALDTLDPLQKQQAIEQLFGKYQFARIGALLDNLGKEGSQTLQVFDLMKASTSELGSIADRELKALTESASGRYKRALESFKAAIADVGEPFLNIFAKILDVGAKILGVFDKMPKPLKAFVVGMGVITALAGPLIMLTGLMANFFGYIIKGVNALRQFRSGAEAFTLVTTETVAADQVADAYTQTLYNQGQAAQVLRAELEKLAMAYQDVIRGSQGGAPGPGVPGVIPPNPSVTPGGAMSASATQALRIANEADIKSETATTTAAKALEKQKAKVQKMTNEDIAQSILKAEVSQQSSGTGTGAALAANIAAGKVMGVYDPATGTIPSYMPGIESQYGERVKVTGKSTQLHHMSAPNAKTFSEKNKHAPQGLIAGFDLSNQKDAKALGELITTGGKFDEAKALKVLGNGDPALMRSNLERMGLVVAAMETPAGKTGKNTGTGGTTRKAPSIAGKAGKAVSESKAARGVAGAILYDEMTMQGTPAPVATQPQATQPVTTSPYGLEGRGKTTTTSMKQGYASGDKATRKSIERNLRKQGRGAEIKNLKTAAVASGMKNAARSAGMFANSMAMSVGTIGMVSSMVLGMTGNMDGLAMKAANFAMALGYGLPAIQGLGKGLKAVGTSLASQGGTIGKIGLGLARMGGPYGLAAIAVIGGITAAIIYMRKKHEEALRKAKADISVSSEAVEKFGGVALNASGKFQDLVTAASALRSKMVGDKADLLGLPSKEAIDAVKEDVKSLMQDQIKAAGGLNSKEAAIQFATNLKGALVAQGVAPAQADAILASILEQADRKEYAVPVMLAIKGIQSKEDAFTVLKNAAEKTFSEIGDKLNSGLYIDEATRGRFATQISDLSAIAVNQVDNFDEIKTVIDSLPEGMKNLNVEQLNATYNGQQFLEKLKETNEPLYESLLSAENLGDAIAQAAGNTLGLVSGLRGVEAMFDIVGQQAQKLAVSEALSDSGLKEAFDRRIAAENKTIEKIKQRAQAKKDAADKEKQYHDDQIDRLKKEIDSIKDQADARKELLQAQKDQADYDKEITKLQLEQKAAMSVGNFSEAAIIGLDIEKKMQDRSVDLAEKAIDDKRDAEVKKRELEVEFHEQRKKEIKELTDAQIKAIDAAAAKEIAAHQKTIASLREKYTAAVAEFNRLYIKAAQGVGTENQKAYNDLKKLLGDSGANVGVLQNTFTDFAKKATSDFKTFFVSTLKSLLGDRYLIDENTGEIFNAIKTRGGLVRGTKAGDMGTGFLNMFGFTGGASGGVGYFAPPKDYIKDLGAGAFSTQMRFKGADGKEYTKQIADLWLDGSNLDEKSAKLFTEETSKGSVFLGYSKPRYMGGPVKKNYKIKAYAADGINTTASVLPYMVGEKGPELFIPGMNGNVVSSDRLFSAIQQMNMSGAARSGSEYNINVNVAGTNASADDIANAIAMKMRLEEQRIGISRTVN